MSRKADVPLSLNTALGSLMDSTLTPTAPANPDLDLTRSSTIKSPKGRSPPPPPKAPPLATSASTDSSRSRGYSPLPPIPSTLLSPDRIDSPLPPVPIGQLSLSPNGRPSAQWNDSRAAPAAAVNSTGSYSRATLPIPMVSHGRLSPDMLSSNGTGSPEWTSSSAAQTSDEDENAVLSSSDEGGDEPDSSAASSFLPTRGLPEQLFHSAQRFGTSPSSAPEEPVPQLSKSHSIHLRTTLMGLPEKMLGTRHASLRRKSSKKKKNHTRHASESVNGSLSPTSELSMQSFDAAAMTRGTSAVQLAELLPDSSHANRRPATYWPPCATTAKASIQAFACGGRIAVTGSGSKVKVYRIASSKAWAEQDLGVHESGEKIYEIGEHTAGGSTGSGSGSRVTALAFKPEHPQEEKSRFIWVGTATGHLWELDLATGKVVASRTNLHSEPIVKIARYGTTMLCLDDGGKVSIWKASATAPPSLDTQAVTPRISWTSKLSIGMLLGDQLWVATNEVQQTSSTKEVVMKIRSGPKIGVYNCFADDKPLNATSRPLVIPSELQQGLVGSITCGTIIPSAASEIFLGHDTGHITLWSRDRLVCTAVFPCSLHAITAVAGVAGRLWVGNANGTIIVFDPSVRPFKVEKLWPAHAGPILGMIVDPFSVSFERLQVASAGGDGHLKVWDGLLATDFLYTLLEQAEDQICDHRTISTLHLTWNIDAAEPEDLAVDSENYGFLEKLLTSCEESPDIIVFGLQELIDLEDKRLTAKCLLMGKKKVGNELGDRVSSQYRNWKDHLVSAVHTYMPGGERYELLHSELLVGLMSCIFVKQRELHRIRDVSIGTIKTGMGGRYGNKGAIVARMVIDDTSICFVNSHPAAGQRRVRQRNQNILTILEKDGVLPSGTLTDAADLMAYVGGGDGEQILDHEAVFLSGDLNYRVDMKRERCLKYIANGNLAPLLDADQLRRELEENPRFRLKTFCEAPINFQPTYKFDRLTHNWDSSEKKRAPAWCDRILWRDRGSGKVECKGYRRWEATISDHRPVSGVFTVSVKKVRAEDKKRLEPLLHKQWAERRQLLLHEARAYYQSNACE